MQKKWYLQTWFLCLIFAFSIFVIPLIIGIMLLIQSIKEDKKIKTGNIDKTNNLAAKIESLQSQLTPEQRDIVSLQTQISELEQKKSGLSENINALTQRALSLNKDISDKQKEIIQLDEEILLQSFGLYKPNYEFTNAEKYRAELEKIRTRQKELIKNDKAATGNMGWTVNGNAAQGKKMVKDMQKLLIRAFNSECDEIVDKVKYNNFDSSLKRITASYEAVSKLGKIMSVEITSPYYSAKIDELRLALEYQQKKQQEKEEQKMLREQMREEAKLQREIEEQRRKIEKEQNHYQNALLKIENQIKTASESERAELLAKKQEIENALTGIDKALKDVDYRQANQRAGYVYVVSNIGAFGENVYKIGMTRRLNPEERIDELGDASVPFDFDIHAMIFCEDAPALESALHKAFENKKLNWINTRREFFNVTLDEIKSVVKANYDKTAEFIDFAEAEQFRTSQILKKEL